jgi:DNA-binding transcriptional ArsR family regulator
MTTRPDSRQLAEFFRALGHENRIELLTLLRTPTPLHKILLKPGATRASSSPDRPLARQTVQQHLDVLLELGLVRSIPTSRSEANASHEFASDHSRLFQILEEVRTLTRVPPTKELALQETAILKTAATPKKPGGPRLVLVHGVEEGRTYSLRQQDQRAGRGWIVGRRGNAHVPLTYDPYVSAENSEILEERGQFRILDLRTARNGTSVNWERLEIGGSATLTSGDVIGVGRSLLVFRDK